MRVDNPDRKCIGTMPSTKLKYVILRWMTSLQHSIFFAYAQLAPKLMKRRELSSGKAGKDIILVLQLVFTVCAFMTQFFM